IPATTALAPLRTLVDSKRGRLLPLPSKLARLYGNFRMPVPRLRPQVFSNFVSTLDGVVSLQVKGHAGGGDISGFSAQDRMVMGLLRAVADVVIVGSGTFGADSRQVWTPEAICPELANDYRRLRDALLERRMALNVIVSASGNIDLRLPKFAAGRGPGFILPPPKPPSSVGIRAMRSVGGRLAPRAILEEVGRATPGKRVLVEGGPHLLGSFYWERLIDEQFLTLAPQIAGREAGDRRLSLVMGKQFAPRRPLWGTLTDVRLGGSQMFLRYSF